MLIAATLAPLKRVVVVAAVVTTLKLYLEDGSVGAVLESDRDCWRPNALTVARWTLDRKTIGEDDSDTVASGTHDGRHSSSE